MNYSSSSGTGSPPKPGVFAAMDVMRGMMDVEQNWGRAPGQSGGAGEPSDGACEHNKNNGGDVGDCSDEDNGDFERTDMLGGTGLGGATSTSPRGVGDLEGSPSGAKFFVSREEEARGLAPVQSAPHRPTRGYYRHFHLGGRDRRYAIAGFSLGFFALVALVVFLSSRRGDGADAAAFGPLQPRERPQNYDFAAHGYPHVQETLASSGWVSWPKDAQEAYAAKSFFLADAGEEIRTPGECAQLCQQRQAPAGAWSVKYGTCWCNTVVELGRLCREPCVADHYVDFSTQPIDVLGYCEKSVCDKEWYHSVEYCEEDVKFDEEACDGTLASIAAGESDKNTPTKPENEQASPEIIPQGGGTHKVSDFYAHTHRSSSIGWVSWYPALDDDNYIQLDESDGVTSLEDCAAECHNTEAQSGAWNVKKGMCFCVHKIVDDLCWEPCVRDEFVNFATNPITWLAYCEQTVCQGEWEGNEEYCADVHFDEAVCDTKLAQLAKEAEEFEATSSTEVPETDGSDDEESVPADPAAYGFPHMHKTSYANWVSWSNVRKDYSLYTAEDGISSLEQCAAKCQEDGALSGAWKAKRAYCFCMMKVVDGLCGDDGPGDDALLHVFRQDVCSDGDQGFIPDSAAAPAADAAYAKITIAPSALLTISRETPDDSEGGRDRLSIEADEEISFVKFDLAAISDIDAIGRATLRLYSITQHADKTPVTVVVDALQNVGDWDHATVSWNNPLECESLLSVESFPATPLGDGETKQLYEVDVTLAFEPNVQWLTLRLTTESSITQRFASKTWGEGDASPELVVSVST